MKRMILTAAAVSLAATVASSETVLKIQSSAQSGAYEYSYLEDEWGKRLSAMTGGEVTVEFFPINAIVDRNETPEAVMAGVLSGDLNSVAYFTGRNPAFAIMGDLIAGYDSPEQVQTFCRHGGGREALQELWDSVLPDAMHVVGCGAVSKEALVSTVEIRGVADLEGVKIRSPSGLAATVFQKAGAAPVSMSISDVFTSLEKGVIDAADASAYINNSTSGFHQVAKYPLYPGIHSMAVRQFVLNKGVWEGMSDDQKLAVETWFYAAYDDLRRQLDLQDKQQVQADQAAGDITVVDWSQEERDKFRVLATEAWEETAAKSPEARKALDAHYDFMKKIGLLKP
ncbi:TRAP transporter substrate-binding protein [Vannielia litorea]|uniref:TRAP-type mannitol/chloroaromatic compound transport system, substrate-binding protein n=1 Tax=Vannielia litorea TaxID=1217970 RepID=A0A1N6IFW4_9RHOB|nr:TRAP transporter substrate-binding protein [Vannielia litorea]SIO30910.1 TRAP-type mannitol/chloroaromatic compound transport system, substrate-binding protein [Vannielia litorea]